MSDNLDIEYGGLFSARETISKSNSKDALIAEQSAELTRLREHNAQLREALDNATSRARMNDSDGAQVPVDNYHLKNGRRLLDASENVVGKSGGEDNGE